MEDLKAPVMELAREDLKEAASEHLKGGLMAGVRVDSKGNLTALSVSL